MEDAAAAPDEAEDAAAAPDEEDERPSAGADSGTTGVSKTSREAAKPSRLLDNKS